MDHVVYLDARAGELEKLLEGSKTMIIRGAAGRKMPYGRVEEKDTLYFINNNGEGKIRARAAVKSVFNSEKMSKDESVKLVEEKQPALNLTGKQFKRWGGKRYLVLVEVQDIEEVEEFEIDRSEYGNMDDWLPVGDINSVGLYQDPEAQG